MSRLVHIVRVEGLGDAHGQWAFTSSPYKAHDPRYRSWMPEDDIPSLVPSEIPPLGGCYRQGEYSFRLVDVRDEITRLLSAETDPVSRVTYYEAAAVTSLEFDACPSAYFYAGAVLFIGREAIRLERATSATTWIVTRAWLGTRARNIPARSPVRLALPFAAGREVSLSIAEDEIESDRGTWVLDAPELDETLCVWSFTARSRDRVLDRAPYASPIRDTVTLSQGGMLSVANPGQWWPHYSERLYVLLDGQTIARARKSSDTPRLAIERLGVAGTPSDIELERVRSVEAVYVCDDSEPAAYVSFRWSATLTYPSAWTASTHPIVVILALLLSGHVDGYGNGNAELGYFACLPFGLGLSADEIDAEGVHIAWAKSQRASVPLFVLESGRSARDLIEAIGRYCGFFVGWSGSLFTITTRDTSSPVDTIAMSDLVVSEGDTMLPQIGRPRYSTEYLATAVRMRTKASDGREITSLFRRADFDIEFGSDSGDDADTYVVDIDAPWVRVDVAGEEPEYLRQRALAILTTFSRPLWTVEITTSIDWWLADVLRPASVPIWAHPQIPDFRRGVRGVPSTMAWFVLRGAPDFLRGTCTWTLLADGYHALRGEIAPSARIASSAGAVVTATANRYTDATNVEGLPTRDAAGFSAGDVVRLRTRDGQAIATTPTTGVVSSINGNLITLDTDFGGALIAGRILEYAPADLALLRQVQEALFLSGSTLAIASTLVEAWRIRRES